MSSLSRLTVANLATEWEYALKKNPVNTGLQTGHSKLRILSPRRKVTIQRKLMDSLNSVTNSPAAHTANPEASFSANATDSFATTQNPHISSVRNVERLERLAVMP